MAPADPPDVAAAAVLAGGAASRMDGHKAGTLLGGKPLVAWSLQALRDAGLDPFVVTKADRPVDAIPGLENTTVVIEPDRPRHPLVGILEALRHAGGRPVIVTGCDLPLLTSGYFRYLAGHPGGTVVPRVGGHLQPLAARFGADAADAVRHGVGMEASVTGVIAGLHPTVIGEEELHRFGDPDRMFTNVNTPGDLERVTRLLDP